MKKISFSICFLLLIVSSQAFSGPSQVTTKVLEVGSFTSGRVFVTTGTNGSAVNPKGCTSVTFGLEADDPNFKEMYTALFIAMTYNGAARLMISDTECIDGVYPKIVFVGVSP